MQSQGNTRGQDKVFPKERSYLVQGCQRVSRSVRNGHIAHEGLNLYSQYLTIPEMKISDDGEDKP